MSAGHTSGIEEYNRGEKTNKHFSQLKQIKEVYHDIYMSQVAVL